VNIFEQLSQIDVSEQVKQKGGFNYLSWPYALSVLLKHHPEATWFAHEFPLYTKNSEVPIVVPYLHTPIGYFVKVSVTIDALKRSQLLPVLDHRNKPIEKPTTFDINTAIQRCLVKALALHGLGLYIYAGEDIPLDAPPYTDEQHNAFAAMVDANDHLSLAAFFDGLPNETIIALNGSFAKGEITSSKARVRDMEARAKAEIEQAADQLNTHINNFDRVGVDEVLSDLAAVKLQIWNKLSYENQTILRQILAEELPRE
jgi:Protein of unknown function (DUF1071)